MENQNYPIAKHSFMYGVYISVGVIILTLIFYVLDLYMEKWPAFFSYAVLLAGVIIASLHYRDKRMGGFSTYGQSFSSGFMAGLFASIIIAIFTFIYITILGQDYIDGLMNMAEEQMMEKNPNMTDEQYDMAMKFTRATMKPWSMAFFTLLNFAFISLVLSLITAIFIKKAKPEQAGL